MSDSVKKIQKRHGRYPWNDWFQRSKFSLQKGEDYSCKPHGMAQMARNQAHARGIKIAVSIGDDGRIDVARKEGAGA